MMYCPMCPLPPHLQEAYYQQAGRAGRDGAPSECRLYWNAGDMVTMDRIKVRCRSCRIMLR